MLLAGVASAGAVASRSGRLWMQGHSHKNFADPKIQGMLLRGIAYAWLADALVNTGSPTANGRMS